MKNIFKRNWKKKEAEAFQQRVSKPWEENREYDENQNKKTAKGIPADLPPWDRKSISCPRCSYPLISAISPTTPCPNCGNTGVEVALEQKTQLVDQMIDYQAPIQAVNLPYSTKCRLIEEPHGRIKKEIGAKESGVTEIVLNRKHFDPTNTTISSEKHILLKNQDGKWYIQDLSSNGATLMQVLEKQVLSSDTRLALGNKFFRLVSSRGAQQKVADPNKTMVFGQFSMASGGDIQYTLIDELTQRHIPLEGNSVILHRENLDPGNYTISSKEHVKLEYTGSSWYITNLSSTQSTYAQVMHEQLIKDKVKLIIGNMIFRFEYA